LGPQEFIQTFTAEKTGFAETKTGAKQTPSISLTEREHGSTKSVHTLHMLYRSPDSIWQGDNCDAVVAVISPGVPMDMVRRRRAHASPDHGPRCGPDPPHAAP